MKTAPWRIFLTLLVLLGGMQAWAQNQTLDGKKHGPWKVRYEGSTVLRYEGTFDRGIPVGTFTHYHPNGTKRAVMVFRGHTQVCYVQEYAENNVRIAEGKYSAPGVKDSTWRVYDLNGKLLNIETYAGGALDGVYQTFYPNGKVVETGTMRADAKTGTWIRFTETGDKLRSAEYQDDLPHGLWVEYDETGRIALRGEYQLGLREGKWLQFSEGKASKGTWYHEGRITKEVEY